MAPTDRLLACLGKLWDHTEDEAPALRALRQGADPNADTGRGLSPLALAVAYGRRRVVRALLAAGARLEGALAHAEEPGTVRILLEAGAEVTEEVAQALLLNSHGALRPLVDGPFEDSLYHLYHRTCTESGRLYRAIYRPAIDTLAREVDALRHFARFGSEGDPVDLYPLGRIVDCLLVDMDDQRQFREFFRGGGLEVLETAHFHPFFHEIVEVQPDSDPDREPVILASLWPGLALGELLIARQGVRIRAGAHHIDPEIATTSTLFWTYRRKHRPAQDLSHGWGSNSQWRTALRRDYFTATEFHYNVDGENAVEEGEVLRHRCRVLMLADDDDLDPYEDRLSEPRVSS